MQSKIQIMTEQLTRDEKSTGGDRYSGLEQAEQYDRHSRARRPDRWLSHCLESWALGRALRGLGARSVLDAPCGTGRIYPILKRQFSEVVSVDGSASMLRVHHANAPAGLVCQADVFKLPFRDERFDWVVCHRLFHHFGEEADRARLLGSLGRVAQCGVIFTAWIETPLNRRAGSRRRCLPFSKVKGAVERAGLAIAGVRYAAWPFQPKAVVIARKRKLVTDQA